MDDKALLLAEVDEEGRIILPPEVREQYGLRPGAQVAIQREANRFHLRRPVSQLAKIYIEPTNRCNLDCVTCIRHSWDEPLGEMSEAVFGRIVEALQRLPQKPAVFLGGLGEPLSHPGIVEMVRRIKAVGSTVELITNATLLSQTMSEELVEAGLDKLWVSLDGATPESYKDVRLGATLPQVLANLHQFRQTRWEKHNLINVDLRLQPQLGIVFVAMKRNIDDFPAVLQLASRLGSFSFLVTNVLPYTPEMQEEVLYSRALTDAVYSSNPWMRALDFPRMDAIPATREALYQLMRSDHSLKMAGGSLAEQGNRCPFVEKGALAIRWDGDVSPCLALLHDHKSYLHRYARSIKRHTYGSVLDHSLEDLWRAPEYLALRTRLQEFNFSPCAICGGCDFFLSNQEDCIGSPTPACGGCLWAQGVIQCP